MSRDRFSIPPLGSEVQTVTVQLSTLSLLPTIQSLISRPDFTYRIEGHIYGSGLFGDTSVMDTGRFQLPQ